MGEGDSSCTNVTDTLMPELGILAASVARMLAGLAQGLVVHPQAMRRNLELTQGLIVAEAVMMRLTHWMGRHRAHQLLYEAAQRVQSDGIPFMTAIAQHPLLAHQPLPPELQQALQACDYVGESQALATETVSRLLAPATRARVAGAP